MNIKEERGGGILAVGDDLFTDTFSDESVYRFGHQELRITHVYSGGLGVAAPVWDAAVCLCRYLQTEEPKLKGKRIIELGAGTGIVGIMAAQLGANVTLTDLSHAIPQLQSNVSANTPARGWLSAAPSVLPLSWGVDHRGFPSDWDLVLGADIVYLSETYTLLLDTLEHLCHDGAVLYLSSKMRREHRTHDFYEHLLPRRFDCEVVFSDSVQNIQIYRAALRRNDGQTAK